MKAEEGKELEREQELEQEKEKENRYNENNVSNTESSFQIYQSQQPMAQTKQKRIIPSEPIESKTLQEDLGRTSRLRSFSIYQAENEVETVDDRGLSDLEPIPNFYCPDASLTKKDEDLESLVETRIRQQALLKVSKMHLFSDDDVSAFYDVVQSMTKHSELSRCKTTEVNYEAFMEVKFLCQHRDLSLGLNKIGRILTPRLFLSMSIDDASETGQGEQRARTLKPSIPVQSLVDYVIRYKQLLTTQLQMLACCNDERNEFILNQEFEKYIESEISEFYSLLIAQETKVKAEQELGSVEASDGEPQTQEAMESLPCSMEDLFPFYLFMTIQKFTFFHSKGDRMRLKELFASPILEDFQSMKRLLLKHLEGVVNDEHESVPFTRAPLGSSWFDVTNAEKVYFLYMSLDLDSDGLLSLEEMKKIDDASFSDEFMEGLFSCPFVQYQRVDMEVEGKASSPHQQLCIDFRVFCSLILALENKNHIRSIQFLFRILDREHVGYLTRPVLVRIVNSLLLKFEDLQLNEAVGDVRVEDVVNEVFDIVRPKARSRITIADLVACKLGGNVLCMVSNVRDFFNYETRES